MSRVQLALNVGDLDQAIGFYEKLFGVKPAKLKDGYANFAVSDPPLKLVLFEGGEPGTINHLGIEVETTDEVHAATRRLAEDGLDTIVEDGVVCCHAEQDKVWVTAPDSGRWEVYTITDDAPEESMKASADCDCGCC